MSVDVYVIMSNGIQDKFHIKTDKSQGKVGNLSVHPVIFNNITLGTGMICSVALRCIY